MKETRTRQVFTKLTENEFKKLVRMAHKMDMTWSSYIQFLIQKAR